MNIDLQTLRVKHFNQPKTAELIQGTPFYRNTLNLVYGLSKSGKTFSVAQVLRDAGLGRDDVIWLDKDYNVNSKLGLLLKGFSWMNDNVIAVEEALLASKGDGEVLVFDSLKDFT